MQKQNLIITGSTGYIGQNLVKKLNKFNTYYIKRNNTKELFKNVHKDTEFTLLHLATYFSIHHKDRNKIHESNIVFGENMLKQTESLNIKKIIYTNTMYNYYKNDELRNSFYSKTKKIFASILNNYCNDKKILYEEIYLDNTFGLNDKRKKLIPLLIEKIKNKEANPIKNPKNSINLMHIDDVVKRILTAINSSEIKHPTSFVSRYSYEINSLYQYLKNYSDSGEINTELILKCENSYLKDFPQIDYKDIKIKDNLMELTKLL